MARWSLLARDDYRGPLTPEPASTSDDGGRPLNPREQIAISTETPPGTTPALPLCDDIHVPLETVDAAVDKAWDTLTAQGVDVSAGLNSPNFCRLMHEIAAEMHCALGPKQCGGAADDAMPR